MADADILAACVHYWKLDEASGSRVDTIGTNDLVAVNSPVNYSPPVLGSALAGDQANARYVRSTDVISIADPFTLAGWMRLDAGPGAWWSILTGLGAGTVIGLLVSQGTPGTTNLGVRTDAGGLAWLNVNNNQNFGRNAWWFMAVKRSGSTWMLRAGQYGVAGFGFSTNRTLAASVNVTGYLHALFDGFAFTAEDGGMDGLYYGNAALSDADLLLMFGSGTGYTGYEGWLPPPGTDYVEVGSGGLSLRSSITPTLWQRPKQVIPGGSVALATARTGTVVLAPTPTASVEVIR